ncbi:hypothetical protein GE061_019756 [Apolygus lucorum]|uniref:Uncharacterized protein n=1 Tax=Apolygus lucorum TaxID=248454 RepID=A0A6A4JR64_APOLU|nr:hypothetical protein GE061_019756 [Apolygus lucorum]
MEHPNFEQKFTEKIEKVRIFLESLPHLVSSSQIKKSTESSCYSFNFNRVTPKVDYGGLLQSNYVAESVQRDSISAGANEQTSERTSAVMSNVNLALSSKKKKKKKRAIDPLRPTKKRSFGVDIGQGINTIVYIKENCCPVNETRKSRLLNIFLNPVPTLLRTEKSIENIYRQPPLSQDPSSSNIKSEQTKRVGHTESEVPDLNVLFGESDEDQYKIRYIDYVTDLSNDFGIDDLQALFVPYHAANR